MGLIVYCFVQEGCMACHEQIPINHEIEARYGITIRTIDAVKNPEYITKFNLKVTPTIVLVKDEEVKEVLKGVVQQERLAEILQKYM